MHRRRSFLVLTLIASCLFALPGGGDSGAAPVPSRIAGPGQAEVLGPPTPTPSQWSVLARAVERQRARERRRREAARRAEARRLRRSRTVAGALRRAWLTRAISRAEYDRLRGIWWRANADLGGLGGTRRLELGAVLTMASRLAAARLLTSSRLAPVFLTIRRNREFWTRRPLPRPGARLAFAKDPVVFQYYVGRGLAIQPLASFGKANALAGSCLRLATRYRCRPLALRRLLNRMLALGTERGGFLAWEYLFRFGGGTPPWISGMTQATGAQAFARGRRALREPRYGRAARRALGAFERRPPLGVAVSTASGLRYTMYSFAPGLRIYNGELQALIGLRDVARIIDSRRARRLYARGAPAGRRSVAAFDTGAWSLYSEGGAESTLDYHRLLGGFVAGLCRRTGVPTYCAAGRRLARYVREAPRMRVRAAVRPRVRRRTAIAFTLSKLSNVMVQVRDRRGAVVFARGLRLARGRHRLMWVPRRVGRHRVRIVALGPAGTRAIVQRTLTVRAVPKKKKAKAKQSKGGKAASRR